MSSVNAVVVCPTPQTLRSELSSITKYEFQVKPMAAVCAIASGIPSSKKPFWQSHSLEELYSLYLTVWATHEKVLSLLEEPIATNVSMQCIYSNNAIYIYFFVEPFLFVGKLLPQCARNRHETRDYYEVSHGVCHKGVDRRQVAVPEESAAQIPSSTEKDAKFFVGLRMANTRFRTLHAVATGGRYDRAICAAAQQM